MNDTRGIETDRMIGVSKLEFLSLRPWRAACCMVLAPFLKGRSAARGFPYICASRRATMPSRRASRDGQLAARRRRRPGWLPIIASNIPTGCSASPVMTAPGAGLRGAGSVAAASAAAGTSAGAGAAGAMTNRNPWRAPGPHRLREIPGALACCSKKACSIADSIALIGSYLLCARTCRDPYMLRNKPFPIQRPAGSRDPGLDCPSLWNGSDTRDLATG
jgi:hypothetical protein